MSADKKNIDILFNEGLKGFRSKAPAGSWERLEQNLDAFQRKKRIFYFQLIAASFLIFLAFGAGYFFATYQSNKLIVAENEPMGPWLDPKNELPPVSPDFDSREPFTAPSPGAISEPSVRKGSLAAGTVKVHAEPTISITSDTQIPWNEKAPDKSIISTLTSIHVPLLSVADSRFDFDSKAVFRPETESKTNNTNDLATNYQPLNLYEYSYDDLPKNAGQLKWEIGAQIAPTKSYREISSNYAFTGVKGSDQIDALNDAENALLSYSGGVNIDFRVGKRWGLQSGLYYSQIGQTNQNGLQFEYVNDEYRLIAINTSTGSINVAYEKVPDDVKTVSPPKNDIGTLQLDNVSLIQRFELIEVPLLLKYRLIDARFFFSLNGGLSPAYLIKNNTWLEMDGIKHDIGLSTNLNSMIINSSLGLGLGYDLSKRLSFKFEPTFRYALNPLNKESEVFYHPYYLSWFTGISYKF